MNELDEIRAWWSQREGIARHSNVFTIAGSPHDQLVPEGVNNPYWEIVRHLPAVIHQPLSDLDPDLGITPLSDPAGLPAGHRDPLVRRYSWAIPSPGDIAWLKRVLDGRSLVEIGAGSGYWAWQARQAGIDVIAYEPKPVTDNDDVTGPAYTDLERGDHQAASKHPDRALLICWPTYDASWAAQTLTAYQGDLLIYIGDDPGGCCADNAFFDELDHAWTQSAGSSPHHITWSGIQSTMTAHRPGPPRMNWRDAIVEAYS
jgi:hypothetical protein